MCHCYVSLLCVIVGQKCAAPDVMVARRSGLTDPLAFLLDVSLYLSSHPFFHHQSLQCVSLFCVSGGQWYGADPGVMVTWCHGDMVTRPCSLTSASTLSSTMHLPSLYCLLLLLCRIWCRSGSETRPCSLTSASTLSSTMHLPSLYCCQRWTAVCLPWCRGDP